MLSILWDVTPEIIDGWKTPNWYGILFVTGLIIGYFVVKRMYKQANMSEESLDKLVIYMVVATIVGARLGHVLFYGPYWDQFTPDGYLIEEGYFSHPLSILKVWEGGLASHGGILAIAIALIIYSKRVIHKPVLWVLDRIAAPGAIGGAFIRLGNLMNSEIVGKESDAPWAFEFVHYWNEDIGAYDPTPRHPAQLYEAIAYFLIFLIIMYMFWKMSAWKRPGVILGTFFILLFSARFFIEFFKVGQAARDAGLSINTGQWLSVPFIIAGIIILIWGLKQKPQEA